MKNEFEQHDPSPISDEELDALMKEFGADAPAEAAPAPAAAPDPAPAAEPDPAEAPAFVPPPRRPRRKKATKLPIASMICMSLSLSMLVVGIVGFCLYSLHVNQSESNFNDLANLINTAPQTKPPQTDTPEDSTPPATSPDGSVSTQPTEPEAPAEPVILDRYATLYQMNSDFVGWIKIDGTKVNYPIMHSPQDPEKYLHLDFYGEYSYPGTPFLSADCTLTSDNYIVYGHNMRSGTMFHSLMNYEKKSYWEEHPTIRFDTIYEEAEYEVVAAFRDQVYSPTDSVFKFYQFINASSKLEFDYAVAQMKAKCKYDTGITPEYGDQLLTLVTCAYHVDDGRFVVLARKIEN